MEIGDNMTMGTAILYPAGCISDILNKVGICGKSVKRVVSHPLSALGKDLTNMAVLWGAKIWSPPQKVNFVFFRDINKTTK